MSNAGASPSRRPQHADMSVISGRSIQSSSSEESDAFSTQGVETRSGQDDPDPPKTYGDAFWYREIKVQRRLRKHDMGLVLDEIRGLRTDVDGSHTDAESLRTDVGLLRTSTHGLLSDVGRLSERVAKGFEDVNQRFEELRADMQIYRSQETNRSATHLYSSIHPIGRYDRAKNLMVVPNQFPSRVHDFLRLHRRRNWNALANLLRFYDSQSWRLWGILPVWSDDESDDPEMLAPEHNTLDEAVEFAPAIALQELASYIGLDYDRIIMNREQDVSQQRSRMANAKRALVEESRPVKRGKQDEQGAPKGNITTIPLHQVTDFPQLQATVPTSPSEQLGWDYRRSENRALSSSSHRIRDPDLRQTQSPISTTSRSGLHPD